MSANFDGPQHPDFTHALGNMLAKYGNAALEDEASVGFECRLNGGSEKGCAYYHEHY